MADRRDPLAENDEIGNPSEEVVGMADDEDFEEIEEDEEDAGDEEDIEE